MDLKLVRSKMVRSKANAPYRKKEVPPGIEKRRYSGIGGLYYGFEIGAFKNGAFKNGAFKSERTLRESQAIRLPEKKSKRIRF
jgi:hypothetical protein